MTVKEVMTELHRYPEDMEVFVCSRECEEPYSVAQSIKQRTLLFGDEEGEEYKQPFIQAVVIDEQ